MTTHAEDARPTIRLRRDYARVTLDLPTMGMGTMPTAPDGCWGVEELFDRGVRHVEIDEIVDFTEPEAGRSAATALVFIRDLTALGLVVSWRVRLPDGMHVPVLLGHLYPPAQVLGPAYGDEIAQMWDRKFYLGRCFWRQGPGFIEVRDRRSARQMRITIEDPNRLEAIGDMTQPVLAATITPSILDEFTHTGLVHRLGDWVWWTPYRIRRWPSPPLAV
jgi:hypothetical protein